MKDTTIFTAALGLNSPWYIKSVEFKDTLSGKQELHIEVDHTKSSKFEYEGEHYSVYDHQVRTWRHLRFFQHDCYLHARVPRVKTRSGKVKLVAVPWATSESSFTLLFELDILSLLEGGMSASAAGKYYTMDSRRVFRIMARHVSMALATQSLDTFKELTVDETSRKKGHNYLTILCDRLAKKVVGIAVGKDKEAFAHALIDMEVRGASRETIKSVTMDMSTAYISAVESYVADADIVFDRFHISQLLQKAVDKVRREEQRNFREAFKNTRYLWLKKGDDLDEDQQAKVSELSQAYPNVGEAYRLKELFREVFDAAEQSKRLTPLNEWIKDAWNSGIEPIRAFVKTLHKHWYGIKTYFKRLATNAYAENVNLKIQEIKRLARGYGNVQHFILMIYFHLGGLDLKTHYKW